MRRASRKPPDEDHPYGHRKYETLAAAGIFVFLLLVVVEVSRSALHRLAGTTVWQRDSADVQPAANLSSAYIPAVASPFTGGFVAVWRNPLADRYARTADLDVGPPRVAVSGLPSHVVGGRLVRLHARDAVDRAIEEIEALL